MNRDQINTLSLRDTLRKILPFVYGFLVIFFFICVEDEFTGDKNNLDDRLLIAFFLITIFLQIVLLRVNNKIISYQTKIIDRLQSEQKNDF